MELRQYATIIWKHLWIIVLTTVLGGGAAFYTSATAAPVYRASTTLEISLGGERPGDTYQLMRTSEMVASTYVEQMQAPVLLREVAAALGLSMSASQLQNMLTVEQIRDTQLIRISAEAHDPALAQALVETTAQTFIQREKGRQRARYQADLDQLEAKIATLEEDIARTQAEIASLGDPDNGASDFVRMERTRLESQLTRDQTRLVVLLTSAEEFRMAMARYTDVISVYSPAETPTAPVGPRALQNTLLGAATGLMIGVGVAFLLEYLDDTIKTPHDVKQTLPTNVLGALPRLKEQANGHAKLVVAEQPLQPIAEAFRNLRTSLEFSSLDHPVRTLLVTSPLPTEGKTFTSVNLAAVIAQGGKSVILVDADLRHPRVHRACDVSKAPGLVDALLSPETRASALRETGVAGLRIVSAGAQAPNPAELLASERMAGLLAWLQEQADVVIFDSPPVLAVTDAAVLSTRVDGVLLVVNSGETRRPAAVQAFERLASVGSQVLGVALNRLAPSGDGYYYYYYSYYGDGRGRNRTSWIARSTIGQWLGLGRASKDRRPIEHNGGGTET